LVPDSKVLCATTGMNEKSCENLRKEAQARFGKLLSAGIEELVETLAEHPEHLDKLTLGSEEKEKISALAEKAKEQDRDIIDVAEKDELRLAEAALAGAMMAESKEPEEKRGFWQRLVARSMRPKVEKETSTGYERTRTVSGQLVHEQYDRQARSGETAVLVNNRFSVTVRGHGVDAGQLTGALQAVDLSRLAKVVAAK